MANYPRGFVAARSTSGTLGGQVRRYRTRGTNSGHIFIGDLAVLASGANGPFIQSYEVATDGTAAAAGIVGVVTDLHDSNKKPLVFSQPTRGPYLPASTDGYVDVNIDPNQTYYAVVNGSVTNTMFGRFVSVDTTVAGTATGISPQFVGTASTISNSSASGLWPLYCIGPADFENEVDVDTFASGYTGTSTSQLVEVKINHGIGGAVSQTMRTLA